MFNLVKEISIDGIFFPPIFGFGFVAIMIWLLARYILRKIGFYALVWHPPLFNTGLFAIILSAVVGATL